MRWMLAGILFALSVGLAIGTVAIRADNVRCRRQLEREYWVIQDGALEAQRLSLRALQEATPERLAAKLRLLVQRAAQRQAGRIQ